MLARWDPEIVLFAGDARADGFGIGALRARRWRRTWGTLARRVVTVPGNHDHSGGRSWTWNGGWDGHDGFARHHSGAFVLRTGTVAVLGFDSGAQADEVSSAQVAWARATLAGRHDDAALTLAVVHSPAFPVSEHIGSSLDRRPEARDRFWAELEDLGVVLVVNGHEHLYARRSVNRRRSVTQIIAAGAGAGLSQPLTFDVECAAAEHHVVLLDINGRRLAGRALSLTGDILDTFEIESAPA
jgi:hypothetical protein